MDINKLFEEINQLENNIKDKYSATKGRVLIANIKTELDYEIGNPADETEEIRWSVTYRDRLASHL